MLQNDLLLASAICIRIFTINYFFWFQPWTIMGQLHQFVRFTDMQTVVIFLLRGGVIKDSLAYNILGLVTFGFWCAKCLGIDETILNPTYPFLQKDICNLYHYINHGLLFALHQSFNGGEAAIGETLLFILFYLMWIYIPWYFFTGDKIYDI